MFKVNFKYIREKIFEKKPNEFGEIFGLSEKTIRTYENGRSEPKFKILIHLANSQIDLNWLIADKGNPPQPMIHENKYCKMLENSIKEMKSLKKNTKVQLMQ